MEHPKNQRTWPNSVPLFSYSGRRKYYARSANTCSQVTARQIWIDQVLTDPISFNKTATLMLVTILGCRL